MRPSSTTLHFAMALLPEGWACDVRVTVADGYIDRVETDASVSVEDERHGAAIPGLPNVHSHAFQRGMAGLAERRASTIGLASADSFWSWREVMYRFVSQIGPKEMQAIAALAYMEMLESGFTRVGEFHYLHHGPDGTPYNNPAEMAVALAEAADQTGIALTLLPVFYAHAGFGGQVPGEGQRRFVNELARIIHREAKSVVAIVV